jgi:hypothetical protein
MELSFVMQLRGKRRLVPYISLHDGGVVLYILISLRYELT